MPTTGPEPLRTAGLRRRRTGEAQGPRAVFRPDPCARLCGWMRRTTPDAKAVAEWRRNVPRQRASCNRGLHRPQSGTDRCEKPRTAKRPPPKAIFRLSRRADATRGALFAREYRWADAARRFGHGKQVNTESPDFGFHGSPRQISSAPQSNEIGSAPNGIFLAKRKGSLSGLPGSSDLERRFHRNRPTGVLRGSGRCLGHTPPPCGHLPYFRGGV